MLEQIQVFVVTFSSILWEAMPFIVLGAVIAGILEELLPQQLIGKILPRYVLPAVMIGGVLGLIFPMCECGIVVVMRRLLRKGLPLSSCIAYMLAGPIVNVIVLLSTYIAFGGLGDQQDPVRDATMKQTALEMTLLRAGLGFGVAVITGLVVHALERRIGTERLVVEVARPRTVGTSLPDGDEPDTPGQSKKSLMQRLNNISETALHDFVDITVFLILGAILAALAKLWIGPEQITTLSQEQPYLAIPAMMLLAIVMSLCSEADAFVAASFSEMTVSAKLAFLVLGPMLDLKLLLMFTRVFRSRLILTIVICTIVQVFACTMLVHRFYDAPVSTGNIPEMTTPTTPLPATSPK